MFIQPAYFYPHCDEEHCSLGSLEFDCPQCMNHNINYENYYDDDRVYKGEPVDITCEHCGRELVLTSNSAIGIHVHFKS